MTGPLVRTLAEWLQNSLKDLRDGGIQVTDRIPRNADDVPWKASIGLSKDGIIVSYTVWDRTELQTELIVVDAGSKETLLSKDMTVENVTEIIPILDEAVAMLIAGNYRASR